MPSKFSAHQVLYLNNEMLWWHCTDPFHFVPNCYCQIAREVLDAGARIIKPGITTDEIDRVIHEETIARGLINLLENFEMQQIDHQLNQ